MHVSYYYKMPLPSVRALSFDDLCEMYENLKYIRKEETKYNHSSLSS